MRQQEREQQPERFDITSGGSHSCTRFRERLQLLPWRCFGLCPGFVGCMKRLDCCSSPSSSCGYGCRRWKGITWKQALALSISALLLICAAYAEVVTAGLRMLSSSSSFMEWEPFEYMPLTGVYHGQHVFPRNWRAAVGPSPRVMLLVHVRHWDRFFTIASTWAKPRPPLFDLAFFASENVATAAHSNNQSWLLERQPFHVYREEWPHWLRTLWAISKLRANQTVLDGIDFLLKADDDTFVDLFNLEDLVRNESSSAGSAKVTGHMFTDEFSLPGKVSLSVWYPLGGAGYLLNRKAMLMLLEPQVYQRCVEQYGLVRPASSVHASCVRPRNQTDLAFIATPVWKNCDEFHTVYDASSLFLPGFQNITKEDPMMASTMNEDGFMGLCAQNLGILRKASTRLQQNHHDMVDDSVSIHYVKPPEQLSLFETRKKMWPPYGWWKENS